MCIRDSLLIEQNANMALRIADQGYVLETGRISLSGTGRELLADESVKAAYLGKDVYKRQVQNRSLQNPVCTHTEIAVAHKLYIGRGQLQFVFIGVVYQIIISQSMIFFHYNPHIDILPVCGLF